MALKNIHFLRKALCICILICSVGYAARPSLSDEFTDRRLTAGAKIFRALLAADLDIADKTDSDGVLRLCLHYVNDIKNAELVAKTLTSRDDTRIRKLEVKTEVLSHDACLLTNTDQRFAAIFLTQNLKTNDLQALLSSANATGTVVFSPMEGDVERGVQGGLSIEARVRPYLNMRALKNGDINLSPFFLRVSKRYAE